MWKLNNTQRIKNIPNKNPEPDGFTGELYLYIELTPILMKLFQTLQRKEHFQTHSMRYYHPDTKARQRYQKERQPQAVSLINMGTKILN